MRNRLKQAASRAQRLSQVLLPWVLGVAGSTTLLLPVQAGWDLHTTWEIEKQLQQFIKELPGGQRVTSPRMFLYRGTSYSKVCTESGLDAPAYCPGDNTVYLEMKAGDEMNQKYGDFGALSIISHEFGHAYLNQTGQDHDGKQGELDADRFAGAFARYAEAKGLLEPGDLKEAQNTFYEYGDHDVTSADHHGLPQERLAAFNRGYAEGFVGQPDSGNTPAPEPTPTTTPAPVPQVPVPAPAPTPQTEAVNPSGVVVALLVSILVVIALVGSVVALIRHSSEED